jgi:hypothetical protein
MSQNLFLRGLRGSKYKKPIPAVYQRLLDGADNFEKSYPTKFNR